MYLDRAPVAGQISARPDGVDQPYWDNLAAQCLTMQRCDECLAWIWGPNWMCSSCRSMELTWTEVEPAGTVYSWTRTWQPFSPEFVDHTPYLSVLVELPGAGNRRILGILLGAQDQDPVVGEPVVGIFQSDELTGGATVLRWRRADDTAALG